MIKIEAIVRPECVEPLRRQLDELGHTGITISAALGCGKEPPRLAQFRGMEYRTFMEKARIELVALDTQVDELVWAIRNTCRTGEEGDGKIFISRVEEAVKIRTGQRGGAAL